MKNIERYQKLKVENFGPIDEKGKKYIADNKDKKIVFKIDIDGGIIKRGKRCVV